MEQNAQVLAKRVWHILRVAYFMLRKNISKKKLLLDLKYLTNMKRPKLTHQHGAYEFSCSNTPNHPNFFPFHLTKNNKRARKTHAPIYEEDESELHAVNRVLEMMIARNDDVEGPPCPYLYSPVLPGFGFGKSPVVRQLRVTDSPYTVHDEGEMGNCDKVDEAAEEFIQRFYNQLRQQKITYA